MSAVLPQVVEKHLILDHPGEREMGSVVARLGRPPQEGFSGHAQVPPLSPLCTVLRLTPRASAIFLADLPFYTMAMTWDSPTSSACLRVGSIGATLRDCWRQLHQM